MSVAESKLKKKERQQQRAKQGETTATQLIANEIKERSSYETRVVISGHIVRGGSPSAL